jgi:vacuolar-type H+-ATPase subunit I/STV1
METLEEVDGDHSDIGEVEGERNVRVFSELYGLKLKLRELERKKEELAACQLKIEEDIQAVKRTMELVAAA